MFIGTISSQLLLDLADFIYVAVDVNQKVLLINRKGCEILGYSEDEIIGKNWFDNFLPKEAAEDIKSAFVKRVTENKETKLAKNYPVLTKEGDERFIAPLVDNYKQDNQQNHGEKAQGRRPDQDGAGERRPGEYPEPAFVVMEGVK